MQHISDNLKRIAGIGKPTKQNTMKSKYLEYIDLKDTLGNTLATQTTVDLFNTSRHIKKDGFGYPYVLKAVRFRDTGVLCKKEYLYTYYVDGKEIREDFKENIMFDATDVQRYGYYSLAVNDVFKTITLTSYTETDY